MSALAVRSERLEALRAHLSAPLVAQPTDLIRFVEAFFADVLPGDLAQLGTADLLRVARFAWESAAVRTPQAPTLRLETLPAHPDQPGRRRMALCIVNDDMPFLVDSIIAELTARNLRVELIFHPIVDTHRDDRHQRIETAGPRENGSPPAGAVRESFIYVELERVGARARVDLLARLRSILGDIRCCVEDWRPMVDQLKAVGRELKNNPPPIPPNELQEVLALLDWLGDDNFTLLGYRHYRFGDDVSGYETTTGHGLLRDPDYPVWRGSEGYIAFSPALLDFLKTPEPVLVTKSNARSPVHRHVHMDYIAVKQFDAAGRVTGEHRFIGLFTSTAYAASARAIPLLRRKVARVIEGCGFDDRSHAGKTLVHVLETFPRDEMIQMTVRQLTDTALGVLSLLERPRPRAFVRRDKFERFVSVLTYIPREAYRSDIRERIGGMLTSALNARLSMYSVELSDEGLARVHYILGTIPGQVGTADDAEIDRRLDTIVRGWDDQLDRVLTERAGPKRAARLRQAQRDHFSQAYREQFSPEEAASDLLRLWALSGPAERAVAFYRRADDAPHRLRLKIYRHGEVIALSDCVPVLENLGLKVIEEYPFEIDQGAAGWVHDFQLEDAAGDAVDLDISRQPLEELLLAVLLGAAENDGFNALTLKAGVNAEQIVWLRAIFRYLRQIGLSFGADTVRGALLRYPALCRALVALFQARHDPALAPADRDARETAQRGIIEEGLRDVASLEDDRALRMYLAVIAATLRTNAFQTPRPEALAFKVRSRDVPDVPLPVPHVEIFVYAPRVEGVHLRGGPVARGGLRWSDRRDDFRTEILGLLKAQMVKNAVIVPVGAKGGFYPKQLPPASDREAWLAEGTACYKIFVRALLSLTDNLRAGTLVPPRDVVRHDGDDPYLVVAADKGTATFSDTANALALDAGFWLGDAFASGGSNGYDHKKMGITARGAWISVERHFREQGLNTATDPFSVIGVGDMSGDVFGNGLLRSRTTRLVAAFDHRHIFIDPDPASGPAFDERQRLFDLPRSSWADYNASLLSAGGGIHPRTAKSIALTPQVKAMLGVDAEALTPTQLIQAILRMPADLLWLGGIGTYVKAAGESHADAGDKANDGSRVNAEELRVRVVGEGANLGVTQKARVAFALRGGAINTDFIDNSAGVDCSDNEVNLKILLNRAQERGDLAGEDRNALLVDLTDAIAQIVLRDNYLQTQALSIAQARAVSTLGSHARLINTLEQHYGLNRKVEALPGNDELAERAKAERGLTRPELAVLLSHAKLALKTEILATDLPDDAVVREDLDLAFPDVIVQRFSAAIGEHRLRREIVATKLANQIVNRGGLTLAFDLAAATGQNPGRIAAAFVAVRACFDLRVLWRQIDAYDYQIAAALQTELQMRAADILRGQVMRFLGYEGDWSAVGGIVERLRPGVQALLAGPLAQVPLNDRWSDLAARGAPRDVVDTLARLDAADDAGPIAALVSRTGATAGDVARLVQTVDAALGLDWLSAALENLEPTDPWDRLAAYTLGSDLLEARFGRVGALLAAGQSADQWCAAPHPARNRLRAVLADIQAQPAPTLVMLTHAVALARQALA